MFKRLFILAAVCAISIQWGAVAYAATAGGSEHAAGQTRLVAQLSEESKKKTREVLPPPPNSGENTVLPDKELKTQVLPRVITLALGLTATAGMAIFVYAGVMLIIAQGNEEDVTKFKNILLWSLIGLAFISAAYALVQGIMKLVLK